jgi:chromosome partitioning protein
MIIAVTSTKGGSGKSTISVILGSIYKQYGMEVLLVDADPQGSLIKFSEIAKDIPTVVSMPSSGLWKAEQVPRLARDFSVTIIDTPPQNNDIIRAALMCANIALVPCLPSPFDLWATTPFIELLKSAQVANPELIAFLLISRKKANTILGEEGRAALEPYELPILKQEIVDREVTRQALMRGITVDRFDPHSKAALEFESLAREVLEYVKQTQLAGLSD